jgi:serine/threonine-protein kinase RsbW
MSVECISLDSRADEVHRLLDWLLPLLARSGFDEIGAFNLQCAIVEAVNNSIQHAYRGEAGHPLEVSLDLSDECAVAEVRDQGPGFDGPAQSGPPDLLSESGRGFAIIEAWVDRLSFRQQDGWNVCRIEKKLI